MKAEVAIRFELCAHDRLLRDCRECLIAEVIRLRDLEYLSQGQDLALSAKEAELAEANTRRAETVPMCEQLREELMAAREEERQACLKLEPTRHEEEECINRYDHGFRVGWNGALAEWGKAIRQRGTP